MELKKRYPTFKYNGYGQAFYLIDKRDTTFWNEIATYYKQRDYRDEAFDPPRNFSEKGDEERDLKIPIEGFRISFNACLYDYDSLKTSIETQTGKKFEQMEVDYWKWASLEDSELTSNRGQQCRVYKLWLDKCTAVVFYSFTNGKFLLNSKVNYRNQVDVYSDMTEERLHKIYNYVGYVPSKYQARAKAYADSLERFPAKIKKE